VGGNECANQNNDIKKNILKILLIYNLKKKRCTEIKGKKIKEK
jgi:hypothetical protein